MQHSRHAIDYDPLQCLTRRTMLFLGIALLSQLTPSHSLSTPQNIPPKTRREAIQKSITTTITALSLPPTTPASASTSPSTTTITNAVTSNALSSKLNKRDPSLLRNSIFNVPPSAQTYPPFLHGDWSVTSSFAGYLFPSKSVPKDKILSNVNVPGFQKCSIAAFADVGRERTTYRMLIREGDGMEDRRVGMASAVDAHLGYDAVEEVVVSDGNPNRISIEFRKNRTRNAERVEIFCNAREAEAVVSAAAAAAAGGAEVDVFLHSEYIRQVTFSLSQQFGVARQVVGNYAHFWTWRKGTDEGTITGNVLTAAYLDAQDPLYFDEPSKPVAVYSHQLTAVRNVG